MYRISPAEYEATAGKLAKIVERAQKRGFSGSIQLTANPVTIARTDDYGLQRTEHWFDVEITGTPPKYQGWTFLATLDWDDYAGLIVRAAPTEPGTPGVNRDLIRGNFCGHCNTNRRRNQTYVVLNEETGQQVQVGSSCIKDFLGWDISPVLLCQKDLESELGFGSFGSETDSVGTAYALAVAWALIKLDGYKPASSFDGATKGDVADVLWPPRSLSSTKRERLARIRDLAQEATLRAEECRAWVLSEDFAGTSDYVLNLKAIAAAEFVTSRNLGYLVSAPQAWAKWQHQTLVKETEVQTSNWIGAVKERITVTAKIHAIKFIPGDYGSTVLYSLRDANGNIIKWFASRDALGDAVGETVTITATVKELATFRDTKETVVTRAKVIAA